MALSEFFRGGLSFLRGWARLFRNPSVLLARNFRGLVLWSVGSSVLSLAICSWLLLDSHFFAQVFHFALRAYDWIDRLASGELLSWPWGREWLGIWGDILFEWIPAAAGALAFYFWWGFAILGALVGVLIFTLFKALFAAHIHRTLAVMLVAKSQGAQSSAGLGMAFLCWPQTILRELYKLFALFARLSFLVLFVLLLPQLLLIAPLLLLFFCARMLALHYFDYAAAARNWSVGRARGHRQFPSASAYAFGLGVLLASFVPGLNFFVALAAVCGADDYLARYA